MTSYIKHIDKQTPRDRPVIIKGLLYGNENAKENCLYPKGIITVVGYYDSIDDAYCVTSHPYYGPFIEPIEWCELPN